MMRLTQILLIFNFVIVYAQRNVTIPQAINLVYKQTMLSQRMAKSKIYQAGKTMVAESQKELASSVILFEKNLRILKGITLDEQIHTKIIKVELMWIGYKKSILDKSYRSTLSIMDFNEIMLQTCNEVAEDLAVIAKNNNQFPFSNENPLFSEAFLSSNQIKYLSQKLALYYTAYFNRVSKYNPNIFKKIITDIDTRILKISKLKNLDVDVAEKTDNLEYNWKNIQALLQNVRNANFISANSSPKTELIFKETNKLLINADKLTRTYKYISDTKFNN